MGESFFWVGGGVEILRRIIVILSLTFYELDRKFQGTFLGSKFEIHM